MAAHGADRERRLLTFNAGSSSLKFALFDFTDDLACRVRGAVRDIGRPNSTLETGGASEDVGGIGSAAEAASLVLDRLEQGVAGLSLTSTSLAATAHRVVHGGEFYSEAVRIDADTLRNLESLDPLAPLHNPPALAVIKAVEKRFPGVPSAALFDTSFFHQLPPAARTYAIPTELARRHAIRRYGFHGIAHQSMSRQLREAAGCDASLSKVVTLHLGQGCSIAALRDGRPVETSMGFTPVEGLVMGTRCGDVDAGILLFLARQGMQWDELDDLLNRRSGLLGLSGKSDDIRELLELESRQDAGAALALAAFCHRINKYLGAYAAVLGGIDAIAFGGGIGENSPVIRARVCDAMRWLGVELDPASNAGRSSEGGCISADASKIAVHVIAVDEEPIIARAARNVLVQPVSKRVSGP